MRSMEHGSGSAAPASWSDDQKRRKDGKIKSETETENHGCKRQAGQLWKSKMMRWGESG